MLCIISAEMCSKIQNNKHAYLHFRYAFMLPVYGIQVPPLQTVPPSLPPRPGASQLRPLPPIPFHSRPIPSVQLSLAPAPIPQSCNPFLTAPLPVPPFNPLPTIPFLRAVTPSGNDGSLSPATSSTGISDFDITSPVPLEGRVPPFPNPFAGAAPVMGALTQDQLLQALNVHFTIRIRSWIN